MNSQGDEIWIWGWQGLYEEVTLKQRFQGPCRVQPCEELVDTWTSVQEETACPGSKNGQVQLEPFTESKTSSNQMR